MVWFKRKVETKEKPAEPEKETNADEFTSIVSGSRNAVQAMYFTIAMLHKFSPIKIRKADKAYSNAARDLMPTYVITFGDGTSINVRLY